MLSDVSKLVFFRCSFGSVSVLQILDRLASREGEGVDAYVRRPSEGVPGGFTVSGFLRLIQLFIDKKQVGRVYGGGGWGVLAYSRFCLPCLAARRVGPFGTLIDRAVVFLFEHRSHAPLSIRSSSSVFCLP